MKVHIVKRKGHKEYFDERKVYASCFAACLNVHMDKHKAEKCADIATKDINKWINKKKVVGSDQIFKEIVKVLKKYDKNAAFMYETHRDLS